jgi:hypothetical protein
MLQERDLMRVGAGAQSRVCPCGGAFRGAGLFPTSARLSVQQHLEPIATRGAQVDTVKCFRISFLCVSRLFWHSFCFLLSRVASVFLSLPHRSQSQTSYSPTRFAHIMLSIILKRQFPLSDCELQSIHLFHS